jgi:hypothetical protein
MSSQQIENITQSCIVLAVGCILGVGTVVAIVRRLAQETGCNTAEFDSS